MIDISLDKRIENYNLLIKQLESLSMGETNLVALLSNASALLNQFLEEINWVGFYLLDNNEKELILDPFQGLPACLRIPVGKGVCGTAVEKNCTMCVGDVNEFPGHIACDGGSMSEIVIPLFDGEKIIGVLDIDSPIEERFDQVDQEQLEKFTQKLVSLITQ